MRKHPGARHPITTGAALIALLCAAGPPARAEIVDIAFSSEGRFERRLDIQPGKFAELCGKLTQGQSVRWQYESPQPLNFNIHYHVGKDVVYPVQQTGTARAEGLLAVAIDQDYCWMWTNKGSTRAALTVRLQR